MNRRGYRLLALALLVALTLPRMWQRGMFLDGMVYAVLARNLAIGSGSIWAPSYSTTVYSTFFEQPPLGFAIEAVPFAIFGDHFWVERAFSVVVLMLTGLTIMAIWRRLYSADYDWLPILFWLVPSVVTWAAINNMLENIQVLVTTLCVYCLVRTCREPRAGIVAAWGAAAGIGVTIATLVKGPVGLFPLAVPATLLLLSREDRPRRLGLLAVALVVTVVACGLLLASADAPRRALVEFARTHLLPALQGTRGDAVTLWDIVRHLAAGIAGRIAVIVGLIWLVHRRGSRARFTFEPAARFFLATALAASLPLLLSPKMAGHYFLPSIPYFALAGAAFALPAVRSFFDGRTPGVWARRAPAAIAGALVLASALVLVFHGTLERRDREMVDSLDAISATIPRGSAIGTCRASGEDWGLMAYAQRFFSVSLDAADAAANGWFLVANAVCQAPAACERVSEGAKLALFRCAVPSAR